MRRPTFGFDRDWRAKGDFYGQRATTSSKHPGRVHRGTVRHNDVELGDLLLCCCGQRKESHFAGLTGHEFTRPNRSS